VITPSTVGWFREHETGDTVLASKSNLHTDYSFNFTPDRDFYYDQVWPGLADRIEGFDRLRLIKAWRGLYEMNPHDHNALIGEHPHLEGFYLINGFSGHGLMQAPAAGRGLAELILYGEYKTLDLSELKLERIDSGKLVTEKMVI
jgi:glycine/D-amino acid oxidase-like deaminating enzyme